jgi:hypothetical protein
MIARNGVARRVIVMHDPVRRSDGVPVIRDPAASETPVRDPAPSVAAHVDIAPTAMRLHVHLLLSMLLVGFGIALGYGAALLVVFLNGRGQRRLTTT